MKRFILVLVGFAALTAIGLWQAEVKRWQSIRRMPVNGIAAQKSAQAARFREIQDAFASAEVLQSRESTAQDAEGQTRVRRLRLVKIETMKYPLLRVEDEWIRTAQGEKRVRQVAMVADHVLVKLKDPPLSEAAFLKKLGNGAASVRRRMPASGLWLIAFANPELDTVPQAMAKLSQMEGIVEIAEADHILSVQATPSDPSFPQLWGMNNTGQSAGMADADIDAPEAWDLHTGSRSVLVAVIDTGIQANHPDLAANLWTHPGEIAANGVDDDNNGYIDDVRGWDYVNWDNDPSDDHGHGTHCAGTIGAVGNNGQGVSGVCWQVSLMGLKFLNASGNGYESDAAEAILYATALGAKVTSNSYSGSVFSQTLKNALDAAGQAGVVNVAAAGNSGGNIDLFAEYPAAYDSPNLISVAATTRTDALASYSNYGLETVDLAAPGSDILSTIPNGGYGLNSGTSMAAPHVTGACALLMSYRPGISATQTRELILSTAETKASLQGLCRTGGRLNLYNAMLAADDLFVTPTGHLSATGPVGGPFSPPIHDLTLTNHSSVARAWSATSDRPWVTLNPSSGTLGPGASLTIQVQIHAAANALLATTHTANLQISSLSTGRVQSRPVILEVNATPVLDERLDSDPGWPRNGEWAYGQPMGQGGQPFGYPDPTAGATGTHVFGIQLQGNYTTTPSPAQYLTAGPIPLVGHHATKLSYRRWLNVDSQPWIIAAVEVSTNGSTWTRIWQNQLSGVSDSSWQKVEHDLSSIADGQASVWVRWVHQVISADAYTSSGWNLDDVQIQTIPDRQVLLLAPTEVTEGDSSSTATLMLTPAPTAPLTFQLSSNRSGQELSFPAFVVVHAGQTEVSFSVTPLDDTLTDGSQSLTIQATADGWPSASATTQVHDNESGVMALTLPSTIHEGATTAPALSRLSLSQVAPSDLRVQLQSSRPDRLQVPSHVIVPMGQQEAFFSLQAVEEDWIDAAQGVQITATVTNWAAAVASTEVTDNESHQINLLLPTSVLEGSGTLAAAGRIQLAGRMTETAVFQLSLSPAGQMSLPNTLVVPAGSSVASFDLTIGDDQLAEGTQFVTVSAAGLGFLSSTASIAVYDNERPALPNNPSPLNGLNPAAPDVDLNWSYDPTTGATPQLYDLWFAPATQELELIATVAEPSLALPRLQPATTYRWRVISRFAGHGCAGPEWTFTTAGLGPIHHFRWDPLPQVVARAAAIPAKITACDLWGNTLPNFQNNVSLSAHFQPETITSGTGNLAWFFPLASYYHDARSQLIYTPAEVGGAGTLTSLALEVMRLPGQILKDFTIRLKHTTLEVYSNQQRAWESNGWTTVFTETLNVSSLGWNTFSFSTPFVYDGQQNLMVDISFNNNSYTSDGNVRCTITPTARGLFQRVDSTHGAPITWTGTSPAGAFVNALPDIRLTHAEEVTSMTPGIVSEFVNGTWSGEVSLQQSLPAVILRSSLANSSPLRGDSNLVKVVSVNDVTLQPEPLFSGGTSNTLFWNDLGPGYSYEIQQSQTSDFASAVTIGPLNAAQHSFAALEDGQSYHYRVRATAEGLTGSWSSPQQSIQDATGPVIQPSLASGGITLASAINLTGMATDSSGVANLTLNGTPVSSTDAFQHWTHGLPSLQDGNNTFTLIASDQAMPPNVSSMQWSILRLSDPASDPDGNGVGSLMEYAFHAQGPSARKDMPSSAWVTDPLTGQKHLEWSYRRLVANPSGVQYVIELSSNLQSWQPAESAVQVLRVEPSGDGVTEVVTVRLTPQAGNTSAQFVRMRLIVP